MRGIVKQFKLEKYKTKEGKKLAFCVEFKKDDNSTEKLWGSYGEEYARKYFAYCNTTTKDVIGNEVDCVIDAREDGKRYIKYLNVLDADGNGIVMKNEEYDIDF